MKESTEALGLRCDILISHFRSLPPAMFREDSARSAWSAFAAWLLRCLGPVAPLSWAASPSPGCHLFGLFVGELVILTAAFSTAHYFIAVLMLAAISVVFGALLHHFQPMLMGRPEDVRVPPTLLASEVTVMGVCALCLVVLGVHIPAVFAAVLRGAMSVLQP